MTIFYATVLAAISILLLFRFLLIKIKTVSLFCLLVFASTGLFAQKTKIDTIVPGKGTPNEQIKQSKELKKQLLSDSAGHAPKRSPLVDTTVRNKYGDLLNDDIQYNKKYPVWKPAINVFEENIFKKCYCRKKDSDLNLK